MGGELQKIANHKIVEGRRQTNGSIDTAGLVNEDIAGKLEFTGSNGVAQCSIGVQVHFYITRNYIDGILMILCVKLTLTELKKSILLVYLKFYMRVGLLNCHEWSYKYRLEEY